MILLNGAEISLNSMQNAGIGLKSERAIQTREKYANESHAFT